MLFSWLTSYDSIISHHVDFPRLSYKPSNDAKIKSSGVARSKPATGRDKMLSFARHSGSPPGDINPDQMLSKPKTNKPRTNSAAKVKIHLTCKSLSQEVTFSNQMN